MKPMINTTLFLFTSIFLFGQESIGFTPPSETRILIIEKTIFYQLAESIVPIKIQQYGDRNDIIFINLHDDETTSVEAAKRILAMHGGMLIEIENNAQRNVRFKMGGNIYKVDPNRIFSKEGVIKSLEQSGRVSAKAIDEAGKFGERIIQLLPENAKCIIALHNNTPGLFSVIEYTAGNKRSTDSKKVFINAKQDPDDFFLTTDNSLYEKLADKGFNTILQDNKNCTEDGSLSVYCGKTDIRYINCETEHGKSEIYYVMMKTLIEILPRIE